MITNRPHGFSLIEIIVSGALIATTLGALFAVSAQVHKLSEVQQKRTVANGFAREGLEIARVIRDATAASRNCEGAVCDDWRAGLLASSGTSPRRIAESVPVAKPIIRTSTGFEIGESALFTRNRPCTDFLSLDERGTVHINQSAPSESNSVWCRRIFLEESSVTIGEEVNGGAALRIRSQVAWLGSGRDTWRIVSPLTQENTCDTSRNATEWCLEYVTLLTDWRTP